MSDTNEVLVEGKRKARDSDGDGVSDVQEGLDGTDPNSAPSRHSAQPVELLEPVGPQPERLPEIDPSLGPTSGRPVVGPGGVVLERETVVDVKSTVPAGHTIDQALPTGLDGKPLPTGPKHNINADGDGLMAGRAPDENSPLNMNRDVFAGTKPAGPASGRDATKDTLGRDPGPGGNEKSAGNSGPPPDMGPSGSADPSGPGGGDLVSSKPKGGFEWKPPPTEGSKSPPTEGSKLPDFDKKEQSWMDKLKEEWNKATRPPEGDGLDNLGTVKPKKKKDDYYDTGEGDGSAIITTEAIEAAIVKAGADTDFVEGHDGSPHIEGGLPPDKGDLVSHKGDGTGTFEIAEKAPAVPPGGQISKPIDPQYAPPGPPPTGGPPGNGGTPINNGGLQGGSYSATAAPATSTPPASGEFTVVGTGGAAGAGTSGGVQTVATDDVTGAGSQPSAAPVAAASPAEVGHLTPLSDESVAARTPVTGAGSQPSAAPVAAASPAEVGHLTPLSDESAVARAPVTDAMAPPASDVLLMGDAAPVIHTAPGTVDVPAGIISPETDHTAPAGIIIPDVGQPASKPVADDVLGAPIMDAAGRPNGGTLVAAGDDDDLEELCVQRNDDGSEVESGIDVGDTGIPVGDSPVTADPGLVTNVEFEVPPTPEPVTVLVTSDPAPPPEDEPLDGG